MVGLASFGLDLTVTVWCLALDPGYYGKNHVTKFIGNGTLRKAQSIRILPENRTSIHQNVSYNARIAENSIKKWETEAIGGFQVIEIIHHPSERT